MIGSQQQENANSMENYEVDSTYAGAQSEAELTRFLLTCQDVIQEKIMHYKGYYYDYDSERYVQRYDETERMMNEKGIEFAQRQFNHFLNKITPTSNLDEKQVVGLIIPYSNRIRRVILTNLRSYGIRSVATLDEVKNDIVEMAFLILTQSINDKGRRFIFGGRKTTEHHTYNEIPVRTQEKRPKRSFW